MDNEYAPRVRLSRKLFTLPLDSVHSLLAQIEEASLDVIQRDPWDALQFLELLSHLEEHGRAADLAARLAGALPATEKYNLPRSRYALWSAAERAEALIAQRQVADAVRLLHDAVADCARWEDEESGPNVDDITKIIDLARRLAGDSQ